MRTLEDNKIDLVEARRMGYDSEAKRLSQEREKLKRAVMMDRRCVDCGQPIAKGATRCFRHSIWHKAYRNKLELGVIVLLLFACSVLGSIIPDVRNGNWTGQVGIDGGIPDSSKMTVSSTVSPGSGPMSPTINAAIAAATSNQVVKLAAGTYDLYTPIYMSNGVVLVGSGRNDQTRQDTIIKCHDGFFVNSISSMVSGGTGYQAGDVVTLAGGSGVFATVTINTVSGGVVSTFTLTTLGSYITAPPSPNSPTGGHGSGFSININISNSGSGIIGNSAYFYSALYNGIYNGGGTANWTAGYAKESSNLTFSATSPGLSIGNIVMLDQSNDTYWVHSDGYEGPNGAGRNGDGHHSEEQYTMVTAVNGSTVTVWPPVKCPFIASGLNPGALWMGAGFWNAKIGIENLTIEGTNSSGVGTYQSNIHLESCRDSWVKYVYSRYPHTAHVCTYNSFRCEIRHNVFYGTQSAAQLSYGVLPNFTSSCLIEDNVFDNVTACLITGSCCCLNVMAYNYCTNNYITGPTFWQHPALWNHDVFGYMMLYEGNFASGIQNDFTHGSGGWNTAFRNRVVGWQPNVPPGGPTANNMFCITLDITNRQFSSIGNILGHPGSYTAYQSVPGSLVGNGAIYFIGVGNQGYHNYGPCDWCSTIQDDPEVLNTIFRHMDYDVVSAGSGITYNSTNADSNLPNSLYLTSKPVSFGSMPWVPGSGAQQWNPTNGATVAANSDTATNLPAGYRYYFSVETPGVNPPMIMTVGKSKFGKSSTH